MSPGSGEAQHGLFEETPALLPDPVPLRIRPRRLVVEVSGVEVSGDEVSGDEREDQPLIFAAVVHDPETGAVVGERAGSVADNDPDHPCAVAVQAGLELARAADATAEVEVRASDRALVERLATEAGGDQVIWTWVGRGDNRRAEQLLRSTRTEAQPPRTL